MGYNWTTSPNPKYMYIHIWSRVPCSHPPMGWGGVWCPCGGVYTYIHTNIPIYLPTYLHTYLPTYLRTYVPTYIPTYLHTYIPTYLPTYLPTYIHTYGLKHHCPDCEIGHLRAKVLCTITTNKEQFFSSRATMVNFWDSSMEKCLHNLGDHTQKLVKLKLPKLEPALLQISPY